MSLVDSNASWLQRRLSWLGGLSAWPDRLVALAFVLVAAGLIVLGQTWLAVWQSMLAWGVYGAMLVVFTRQGWVKLFGPVLFYDMVRTARRTRYSIMRMLYAGFLLTILCYMFFMLFVTSHLEQQRLEQRNLAMLTESFFMGFIVIQLILVVLLTPAYVAGAIAEEKDRKTLEFMLATDLRNREIILSKLLSRLANMSLLLLTGLPILSILQFIGGVDPELVLAGFAGIGLTMLGIASISMLFSTLFQKPRDAISLTYLMLVAYVSVATIAMVMLLSGHRWMSAPIWFGANPWTVGDAVRWFNAGNPLGAIFEISSAIGGRGGASLATQLPAILERYAWFHVTLAVICVCWSIARVRAIALKQTSAGTTAKTRWWHRLRPAVGSYPMLWKEFFIEGRIRINWLVWMGMSVLVIVTFGSGLWIVGDHLINFIEGRPAPPWRNISEEMKYWFRIAGTFTACLLLLMVGVRASTSITTERERDTFDALLTTPMGSNAMLFAKLLGNLLGMRLGWVWFLGLLGLGVCTGGVHPICVPFILGACVVYSVVVTMIGLAFSMYCRSSLAATVMTVLALLLFGGGHWLITTCVCMPAVGVVMMLFFGFNRAPPPPALAEALEKVGEYFLKFQAGITPPAVFSFFSFSWRDFSEIGNNGFNHRGDRWYWEIFGFSFFGLFLWSMACVILWFGILAPTFRRITRREELIND